MAATNRVRISAGHWRSRLLAFPDAPGLRPTPERVRQTLFNWLGQELNGLHCLDLFSGTGVLGFEALSRGAASAVMVEKNAAAFKALQENKRLLQADTAQLLHMDAMQFLHRPPAAGAKRYDLVFMDPPYREDWLPKILPLLPDVLAPQGLVYAEAEFAIGSDANWHSDANWQVIKQGKAGHVFYHLLALT